MFRIAIVSGALLLSASAHAQLQSRVVIPVTCENFVSTFNSAPSGATLMLSGSCDRMVLKNRALPITVIAGQRSDPRAEPRATIRGLEIDNVKGLTWTGGHFRAPQGKTGVAAQGYGVHVVRSEKVNFNSIHIQTAAKGFLVGGSKNISLLNSYLEDLRVDGVNFVDSDGLRMINNTFRNFSPNPTTCTFADGSIQYGVGKAACEAAGGTWKDGDHPDVFQTWHSARDRVRNILLQGNDIFLPKPGWAMGLTTHGSKYVENMQVLNNRVLVDHPTGIRIDPCHGNCVVRGNIVGPASDTSMKVWIYNGKDDTVACENTVLGTYPYGPPYGVQPCP